MKKNNLTLLIPVYNEEKIIKNTLLLVSEFLSKQNYSWEILVVNDGSKDSTLGILTKIKNSKIRIINTKINRGKGAALRAGVKESRGKYIIFSDADLSVPIENINKFLTKLKKGSQVVVGSRRTKGSEIEVHQPLLRESMGRFFTFLTKIIIGVNLTDFTCGFKGFEESAGKKIFVSSLIDRWAYDAEILFLANKFGYEIEEIPISWRNRSESRVTLSSAVFTSFRDLLKIRVYDFLGKYNG